MSTLRSVQHWAEPNEEVYVAVIRQKDTSIPEQHWEAFVSGADHQFTEIWEAAQEALEKAYEDWKEDEVCEVCDEDSYNCECEEEEEEEEDSESDS